VSDVLTGPMRVPILQLLSDLHECVCESLALNGQGPTCWCGIWPGETVSWDYCGAECKNDACGMAWVRAGTSAPYSTFPLAELDSACEKPLFYEIEVGVLRCLPIIEDDGSLPAAADITEAALGLAIDQMALHRAIRCCRLGAFALGAWRPVGPQGGCVGGFWTLYVDPTDRR
jgi:hypothetical protein